MKYNVGAFAANINFLAKNSLMYATHLKVLIGINVFNLEFIVLSIL